MSRIHSLPKKVWKVLHKVCNDVKKYVMTPRTTSVCKTNRQKINCDVKTCDVMPIISGH